MIAEYIQKRNQSLHRMLTCLGIGELIIWLLSALVPRSGNLEEIGGIVLFLLISLGVAAIVFYLMACEQYLNSKGSKNSCNYAGAVFLVSLLLSPIGILAALVCGFYKLAYFVPPIVFTLGALPLKLMRDRT